MRNEKIERLIEREGTGISWADLTFNPWIGCTKVSPACDHCYAEELATNRLAVEWGPGAPRRRTRPGTWAKPRRWEKIAAEAGERLTVFCASLADIFDNEVDPIWRADLGRLIIETPHLDWMVLTKRIPNARAMIETMFDGLPPPNFALGVTIANQAEAERDLPRAISVSHGLSVERLFISAEPLLGPLDLDRWIEEIDLLIVGGESGRDARPMDPDWVLSLRDQCEAFATPFHFKQWGEWLGGGQGNPHGVDLGRYRVWIADGVEKAYRVGVRKSGHLLDGQEHREHFN